MKIILVTTVALLALTVSPSWAALEGKGAAAVDTAGNSRTNFNSTESIGFLQKVNNTASSLNLIAFTYNVTDPNNKQVFSHSGNAAPGLITGESASQITGISVSQIYTVPGNYTLTTTASLDGQTLTQQATFNISSPILTLLYPSNGATDLIASPLTFTWSGSGASRYRVSVDDDISFYNTLFIGLTNGSETSFNYPDNPTDSRQKLAAGQLYYWKIEGLDANGNKVSEAGTPFTFTLFRASSKSRDIAVTNIEVLPELPVDEIGVYAFGVTIKNQGNQTESNIPVNLYVNGVPAKNTGNPMTSIAPLETQRLIMQGAVPSNMTMAIALATVDFFDDNVQNNRMTINIDVRELIARESAARPRTRAPMYTFALVWNVVREALFNPFIFREIGNYRPVSWQAQGLSQDQANELMEDLKTGRAKIVRAWVK